MVCCISLVVALDSQTIVLKVLVLSFEDTADLRAVGRRHSGMLLYPVNSLYRISRCIY